MSSEKFTGKRSALSKILSQREEVAQQMSSKFEYFPNPQFNLKNKFTFTHLKKDAHIGRVTPGSEATPVILRQALT